MNEKDFLADQFESQRGHLRAVAYRMLGSLPEAEDAVQQAWLRLNRNEARIDNLAGWLTTVVARVSLDMLRARESRREAAIDETTPSRHANAEDERVLADSVGLALLVVLEMLTPAERLAFVLHDLFGMSFDDIAPIVDRTPEAARQLASRARRRVHGSAPPQRDVTPQREIIDAFLAATRGGDFNALLAILDPDVVLRMAGREMRGAQTIATNAMRGGARAAQAALVNGEAGVIVAPNGKLMMVLRFSIEEGKIKAIDAVTDAETLRGLELAVY